MILSSSATNIRDQLVVSELESQSVKRILIVGGSGFIASGLINYFQHINYLSKSKLQVKIFSRSPKIFTLNSENIKVLEHPRIEKLSDFYQEFNPQIVFYLVRIDSSAIYEKLYYDNLQLLKYHLEASTLLRFTARFVFLSSGAVYGPKQIKNDQVPLNEDLNLDLETLSSYGKIKLQSEKLIHHYHREKQLKTRILRLFAFFGPGLPLENFAIGNFMLSSLHKQMVEIHGTGKTIRSYMYIDDLSSNLIRLALKESNIVNVGGEAPINLLELANIFQKIFDVPLIILAKKDFETYYVPDLRKAKSLLGEINHVSLEEGIQFWHRSLINSSQN